MNNSGQCRTNSRDPKQQGFLRRRRSCHYLLQGELAARQAMYTNLQVIMIVCQALPEQTILHLFNVPSCMDEPPMQERCFIGGSPDREMPWKLRYGLLARWTSCWTGYFTIIPWEALLLETTCTSEGGIYDARVEADNLHVLDRNVLGHLLHEQSP